jgi:hypothetical protein
VIKHNFDQLNFGQPTPCPDFVAKYELYKNLEKNCIKMKIKRVRGEEPLNWHKEFV